MDSDFAYKLRHIFMPAAAASVLLLAGYSALNWLLLSRLEFLDQNTVDYWIPALLAIILELTLVLSRIQRLALGNGRAPAYYNMVAIALLAAPVMLGQIWVRASTGEITHVADSGMIAKAAHTRYYAPTASVWTAPPPVARASLRPAATTMSIWTSPSMSSSPYAPRSQPAMSPHRCKSWHQPRHRHRARRMNVRRSGWRYNTTNPSATA